MGKYLVNTYSTIRKTNGDTFRYEGFTKVLSENVVKIAKQANKEVGYKYVGRFKDTQGRYIKGNLVFATKQELVESLMKE